MELIQLLQPLPDGKNNHFYLLFEAGAQSPEGFKIFHSEHASIMYPLYIHPQLKVFQDYGPWLLEVGNLIQLSTFLAALKGSVSFIVAHRHLSSVAIQLSKGCTVVGPDSHTSLVRFYAPHVIHALALSSSSKWHASLFRDISQWWVQAGEQWEQVIISRSVVSATPDSVVRLDEDTWRQITDKPEVSSIVEQWQKMPTSQHFPPCVQRNMVIKALDKAKSAGFKAGTDSKLYALFYLNGGKKLLESEVMQAPLQEVKQGRVSLADVLVKYT